jgi:hypothetical protein
MAPFPSMKAKQVLRVLEAEPLSYRSCAKRDLIARSKLPGDRD